MRIFCTLMLFMFTLSFSETHVFWYRAKANNYDLALCSDSGKGPCLPDTSIIHEGMIASGFGRSVNGYQSSMFEIGSGIDDVQGASGFIWSKDLCASKGTAVAARVRAEYKDCFSDLCPAGPIKIRCGVIDFTGNLSVWGGIENVPDTARWVDEYHPLQHYIEGYNIPLECPDSIYYQAPQIRGCFDCPPILDSLFFEINITNQVNWILSHEGQFAIVFLVAPNKGSTGNFSTYSFENCPPVDSIYMRCGIGHPWTRDGNTMHIVVESDNLQDVEIEEPKDLKTMSEYGLWAVPNPFKSLTVLSYILKAGGRIDIYDISGRAVKKFEVSGTGRVEWDAGKCAPGVYIARLMSGSQGLMTRLLVVSR